MLTIAKITASGSARYAEYLEGKTQTSELGDYYLNGAERVEAPGRWVRMTAALGSQAGDSRVSGETLRDLMAVRYPGSEVALRRVGSTGEAVAALDATFSAPKSVSAVWALADAELRHQVEVAHERAINRAVSYALEQVPMVRQRIDADTVLRVNAKDVIATSWRHTTARSVDGEPPDPQLHSHVLLHGAIRADGRVVAIESRAWMQHRREIAAAYRTELAREMTQLGFQIQRGTGRGGAYFEIAGIPRELLDVWSSRSRQIEAALREQLKGRGITDLTSRWDVMTAAQDRQVRLTTREQKSALTHADLDSTWTAAAEKVGFGRPAMANVRQPELAQAEPVEVPELVSALTECKATFADREARAVALERSAGSPIAEGLSVLTQARDSGEVLKLADGSSTTAAHRRLEQSVLAAVLELTARPADPIRPSAVNTAQAQVNGRLAKQGARLSDEQQTALALASGDRRVVMIEGQAGTGKSTVLQAVALAHQAEGRQVIVTSTGALAAQRLAADLADAGVQAPAYSTAAFGHAVRTGRLELDEHSTVIHDEAALASTREQHAIFTAVKHADARLVLVGDPEQNKPVGAGGLWQHLETQLQDGGRAELTINLRAHDPADQVDQARFRNGDHEQALASYQQRGRLWLDGDLAGAEGLALIFAHGDRQAGKRTLVIAQTSNDHLDELNAQAQAGRIMYGELGTASLPIPGRPYALHPGDHVQIRNGIRIPDHGRVSNGTEATVVSISPENGPVALRLSDGSDIALTRAQVIEADTRLAYVQHPFPAQGSTVDTAHLIVGEHASREGSYEPA